MESWALEPDHDAIRAALTKLATPVETNAADAEWTFRVGGGVRGVDVVARASDGLLLLDAALPSRSQSMSAGAKSVSDCDWSHLEAARSFAGGVKLARVPGGRELRIRAELPVARVVERSAERTGSAASAAQGKAALSASGNAGGVLHDLRAGLRQAVAYGRTGAVPKEMLAADLDDPERPTAELAALCSEAGWPFEPRQGSGIAELDVGARFEQALLTPLADGSLRVSVELAGCSQDDEPSASAEAHCLMRAAGFFRLIRPIAARGEGGRWQPRYEVSLTGEATAADLDEALSALSVAFEYSAEELRVLATEAAAAATYLQLQASGYPASSPTVTHA